MAYRTISQSFWNDSKIVERFTPEDKYFMLYLLTNPHVTLMGCYEITIKQMSNETGYDKEAILNLLARFKNQHQVIDYSEEDNELLIKNWYRYNWAKSPKVLRAIRKYQPKLKCARFRDYIDSVIPLKFGDANIEQIDHRTNRTSNIEQIEHRTSNIDHRAVVVEQNNIEQNNISHKNISHKNIDHKNIDHKSYVSIPYGYHIDTISEDPTTVPTTDTTPEKKIYGAYKNVTLTDDELEEFKKAYPTSYEVKIDRLSFYMAKSGKAYQNHYAVLMEWAKEDEEKAKKKAEEASESSFDAASFYETALLKSYEEM